MRNPKSVTPAEIQRALYRKPGKAHLDLETQLLHTVLDFLPIIGLMVERRNVGGREWLDAKGRRRVVKFGATGQSDVWFIGPKGTHGEIELKAPGEEPTEEQRFWLKRVRGFGAIAFATDSMKDCTEKLKAEYAARNWPWRAEWECW